jgi:formiminotetrahydrofolate cyclodeaminase
VELQTYLDDLASAAPTPGGGSAATIVAALGAALVAMVARITRENGAYAERHALARTLVEKADAVRAKALAARERDEAAYGEVVAAMALPKTGIEQKAARTAALQSALRGAAEAPLATAEIAKLVAVLTERALELDNPHLASDLGCAAEFASSALLAAAWNVRVNHKYMKDRTAIDRQESELARYERETAPLIKRVRFEVARSLAR